MYKFCVHDKPKNVLQGEASFFDIEINCLRMEDVLAKANQKKVALQIEERTMSK
jgi:hypothetical protein